jgi:hypothetical protein
VHEAIRHAAIERDRVPMTLVEVVAGVGGLPQAGQGLDRNFGISSGGPLGWGTRRWRL